MEPRQFYDSLASTYHALYPDWESELTAQAEALLRLLGAPAPGATIVDPACGIGTQLLGLAAAGYRVVGSDISAGAVDRARDECTRRGLAAQVVVADMRALPWADGVMDALVCADNAIPHLLTDEDVASAFGEFNRVLPRWSGGRHDPRLRRRPRRAAFQHPPAGRGVRHRANGELPAVALAR